jgi:hypothetical protein
MATLKLPSFQELCESIGLRGGERDEQDTVQLLSKISTKPSLEARSSQSRKTTIVGLTLGTYRKIRKHHEHKCNICDTVFKRRHDRNRHSKVNEPFL